MSIQPFKFYVQKVFPAVYDDSLSYYELLCKVIEKLNEVIEQGNTLSQYTERELRSIREEFESIKRWIEDYVMPEQIEETLDEWLANGKLAQIINSDVFGMKAHQNAVANMEFKYDQYNIPKANSGAIVTFIDDDGHKDVLTRLKPMFDNYGLKFTIGVITNWAGNVNYPDYMTWDEIKQLADEGHEIASHSHTHRRMADLTNAEQLSELYDSRDELLKRGFNPKHFIYPQGDYNDFTMENVLRFYKSAIGTKISSQQNGLRPPLTEAKISRIGLGSWQDLTTQEIKNRIDAAVETGSWIIFMTHIWANDSEPASEGNAQAIQSILSYCANHGSVTVETYDKAFRRYMNRSMLGNNNITNKPYHIIGADFQTYTNQTQFQNKVQETSLGFEALPSAFEITNDITVTYKEMTAAESTNSVSAPVKKAGLLVTEKIRLRHGYTKQTFKVYQTNDMYVRTGQNDDTWGTWQKITTDAGNTSSRPTNPPTGYMYWDNTISKPIWWSGTRWRDANGDEIV